MSVPPPETLYQVDPETTFLVVSPRVYALRRLQVSSETNLLHLRLEQRGLAPVTYMHHVSKIVEGKGESFRVRICRTCSGLPSLLELGSYSDVESALLINDAHELMQGRFKNLHLLCREDINYLQNLMVRKRGSSTDQPLLQVLQERIWKNTSNETKVKKANPSFPEESSSLVAGALGSLSSSSSSSSSQPAIVDASVTMKPVASTDIIFSPEERDATVPSHNDDIVASAPLPIDSDARLSRSSSHSVSAVMNPIPSSNTSVSNVNTTSTISSTTSSSRRSRESIATSLIIPSSAISPHNNTSSAPTASTSSSAAAAVSSSMIAMNRQLVLFERFKLNVLSLRTELLFWGYCSSAEEVDQFHDIFISSIYPGANQRLSINQLYQFLIAMSIPPYMVYSLLSSLYPGEVSDLVDLYKMFDEAFQPEQASLSRFRSLVDVIANTLETIESAAKKPDHGVEEIQGIIDVKLGAFISFLRMFRSMVCYYDYAIHLCPWENKASWIDTCDVQDAEIRLYGIYGQLEQRIQLVMPLLTTLQHLLPSSPSTATTSSNGDMIPSSSTSSHMIDSHILEDISNSLITSLIHSYLSLSSAALILSKVCHISSKPIICLSYYQHFLPILKQYVGDKVVCQLFIQAYLDLLCHTFDTSSSSSVSSSSASSFSSSTNHRIVAFSLGIEFVQQTKHYYWNVPYNIIGSEAIIFFEAAFRSYVTIFQLVMMLEESDFLHHSGLDMMKLLNAISSSLSGFFEWMQKQSSSIMNLQTLLSLRIIIETSLSASMKYPAATSLLYHIIRLARLMLVISSSRCYTAKILLDQLIFTEEMRLAQIISSSSSSAAAAEISSSSSSDMMIFEQQRNLLFPIISSSSSQIQQLNDDHHIDNHMDGHHDDDVAHDNKKRKISSLDDHQPSASFSRTSSYTPRLESMNDDHSSNVDDVDHEGE